MINAEVVHAAEAGLGEGCVWSPVEDLLVWVDINGMAVHRFDHASGQPVGLWRYPETVGNAAIRAGGGLALGLGVSVTLTDQVGAIETVIQLPGEPETNRANDGAVDPRGRLFQGTMSNTEPGAPVAGLHRVDGDGTSRRVLSDVMISNGIGWSPDQSTMYYIDTLTFRVDQFDYDPDTGEIEGRRPFVAFDGSAGAPDGIRTVAEPEPGGYDAIVIAVGHDAFRDLGAERIRSFGRTKSVVFDVKHLFPAAAVDDRL